jgi:hypothetical protein
MHEYNYSLIEEIKSEKDDNEDDNFELNDPKKKEREERFPKLTTDIRNEI